MPIYRLNTNDIYVKNLRLAADDSEVDDAVLTASIYDQTQFNLIRNGMPGTAITGASNISLVYQSTSTTPGHYRGSIQETVGLTVGTKVWVNFVDDGTYGIDVWKELTVQRRTA